MPKKTSSEEKIYEYVCNHPGQNTYSISKRLKMSGGKVRHALSQLNKKGLIKFKFIRYSNPRIEKLSYPVSFYQLFPKKLRQKLKELRKK